MERDGVTQRETTARDRRRLYKHPTPRPCLGKRQVWGIVPPLSIAEDK
jgi:hypothetical protein